MTSKKTTTPAAEKLFDTPWTGGPNAVSIAVYADHAKVTRFTGGSPKRIPLTTAQVATLRTTYEDTTGDVETATTVAVTLNSLTKHAIGLFSSMAGGQIGTHHASQMEDIQEAARWI